MPQYRNIWHDGNKSMNSVSQPTYLPCTPRPCQRRRPASVRLGGGWRHRRGASDRVIKGRLLRVRVEQLWGVCARLSFDFIFLLVAAPRRPRRQRTLYRLGCPAMDSERSQRPVTPISAYHGCRLSTHRSDDHPARTVLSWNPPKLAQTIICLCLGPRGW